MRRALAAVALVLWALPVLAVQPGEMLADPALEARARALSQMLRCPVCQGENIDDSNAAVARDLRLMLRERLVAGDSDQEALDYLVYGVVGEFAGFGEGILMQPPARGLNLILWGAPPALLLTGLGFAITARRRARPAKDELNAEEQARLEEILRS